MKIREITRHLEEIAPLHLQESYDNSGLQIGNPDDEATGALICIDINEAVLDEAVAKKANLVISHHPLIFSGIKKITDTTSTGRIVRNAIQNNLHLYALHTNLDAAPAGVSAKMAEKLGLTNMRVLDPLRDKLVKLVFFTPHSHAEQVRQAIFQAGAGHIGNYDSCSFNSEGKGTFRGNDQTNPFVGQQGALHTEDEIRTETIFPAYLTDTILRALRAAHPYEEAAYDIYPLKNEWTTHGMGIIADTAKPVEASEFLSFVKKTFGCGCVRHTLVNDKKISRIALCGGSGSTLIPNALAAGAHLFITADLKYHQFFDYGQQILLADIGHYESEQFTKELIFDCLTKKFTTFAVHFSETNTNPIQYL